MAKACTVEDCKYDATKKNNPPVGLAAIYEKPILDFLLVMNLLLVKIYNINPINLCKWGVYKCTR